MSISGIPRALTAAQINAAITEPIIFWSDPVSIQLTTTAGDKTLGNVVIPSLTGKTISRAYAIMKINRIINGTAAAENSLVADQYIQVDCAAAGYINAIKLLDNDFHVVQGNMGAGRPVGEFRGSYDISSRVTLGATTNFKWAMGDCNSDTIDLTGITTGIIIYV